MSTASQFGGGGIKSIQRGTIAITGAATSNTATITSVNTAKTELRYLGTTTNITSGGVFPDASSVMLVLTNSTTITASRVTGSNTTTVSWELTERY